MVVATESVTMNPNAPAQRRAAQRAACCNLLLGTSDSQVTSSHKRFARPYLSRALRCVNAESKRSLVASDTFAQSVPAFSEKYRAGR